MVLLFLGNWRCTLIIALTIPLSILASILVLQVLGETLNLMTLGGLALSVGILVDQAIVTIENIERHLHLGKPLERGDPRRRRRDRRAGVRLDAVHLHRVRADVLPVRRRALPVRAAGRGGGLRDGRVLHPVAHAGADAGHAADARRPRRAGDRRAPSLLQRIYRAFDRAVRARARAPTRSRSRRCCDKRARLRRSPSSASASLSCGSIRSSAATSSRASMPARSACTCARPPARASRRRRASPTRSRRRSASSCRRTSSRPSSTTSACPTAASTCRTATPAPSARSTARSCCRCSEGHRPTEEFVTLLRARAAEALPRHRVLLPAGRHRHADPQLRPARGDRRAVHRQRPARQRGARRRAGEEDPADSRRGRRARAPAPRRARARPADGPHAPAADGPVGAERRPERAGRAVGQLADGAGLLAQSAERRRLQHRGADAAVPASIRSTRCSTCRSRRGARRRRASTQLLGNLVEAHADAQLAVVSRYNIPPAIDVFVSVQGTDLASVAGAGAGAGRRGAARSCRAAARSCCAARCRRCRRRSSAWASAWRWRSCSSTC